MWSSGDRGDSQSESSWCFHCGGEVGGYEWNWLCWSLRVVISYCVLDESDIRVNECALAEEAYRNVFGYWDGRCRKVKVFLRITVRPRRMRCRRRRSLLCWEQSKTALNAWDEQVGRCTIWIDLSVIFSFSISFHRVIASVSTYSSGPPEKFRYANKTAPARTTMKHFLYQSRDLNSAPTNL